MEQNPSTIAPNGRDHRGKFAPGNPGGPGNPHVRKVAKLRRAMLAAVSTDDIKAVVAKLVEKALDGDVVAIRELLDRCLGKAPVAITGSDGGPIELAAIRDNREIFDVNGFAEHLRQFEAHQSDEAKRIAS